MNTWRRYSAADKKNAFDNSGIFITFGWILKLITNPQNRQAAQRKAHAEWVSNFWYQPRGAYWNMDKVRGNRIVKDIQQVGRSACLPLVTAQICFIDISKVCRQFKEISEVCCFSVPRLKTLYSVSSFVKQLKRENRSGFICSTARSLVSQTHPYNRYFSGV